LCLLAARHDLKCSICDRSGGVPVQCFNPRCVTAYHTSCAYANGWVFKANPRNSKCVSSSSSSSGHTRDGHWECRNQWVAATRCNVLTVLCLCSYQFCCCSSLSAHSSPTVALIVAVLLPFLILPALPPFRRQPHSAPSHCHMRMSERSSIVQRMMMRTQGVKRAIGTSHDRRSRNDQAHNTKSMMRTTVISSMMMMMAMIIWKEESNGHAMPAAVVSARNPGLIAASPLLPLHLNLPLLSVLAISSMCLSTIMLPSSFIFMTHPVLPSSTMPNPQMMLHAHHQPNPPPMVQLMPQRSHSHSHSQHVGAGIGRES